MRKLALVACVAVAASSVCAAAGRITLDDLDRIADVRQHAERYPTRRHVLLDAWRKAHEIDPES